MRLFSTMAPMIALAVGFTLVAPVTSQASDGATSMRKHDFHAHRVAYSGLPRAATALAPALVPAAPAPETDGLSRNREDCNYGCIDSN